jgi:hypothetical protein
MIAEPEVTEGRERDEALLRKLVSAARALVTYQVGLPHGITRIFKILSWLGWESEDEYLLFKAYGSETVDLPIGTERLLCEREALRRFDERLKQINASYRDEVFEKCFDIIDRFGSLSQSGSVKDAEL